jgi:hypothetical protein
MKIIKQGYGARLYFKFVLNKLKQIEGPTSIYTPLKTYLKWASMEVFMCPLINKVSYETFKLQMNYVLSTISLRMS